MPKQATKIGNSNAAKAAPLFRPFTFNGLAVPSRMAMAPISGDIIGGLRGEAREVTGIDALLRIANDEFDLVAVGRAIFVDPQWTNKIRHGRFGELRVFHKDAISTLYWRAWPPIRVFRLQEGASI